MRAIMRRPGGILAPAKPDQPVAPAGGRVSGRRAPSSSAQREPVLKQIDEPHPYYFREMYLPQLTTGPSAVAWAADARSVVYSMAGSLWQQRLDSSVAEQLTSGPGYDYQPDCSSDGRWVVYATYARDAVELWALNLQTKATRQLTTGRRRQRRAPVLARWHADRIRFHLVQRTLSYLRGAIQQWRTEERPASNRGKPQHPQPLLLQPVRSRDQPGLVAGWQGNSLRLQSRPHLRHGRLLADEGGAGRGSARDSLRRDGMESAAGLFARWQTYRLRVIPGTAVAPALGVAVGGWRRFPAFLWRFR